MIPRGPYPRCRCGHGSSWHQGDGYLWIFGIGFKVNRPCRYHSEILDEHKHCVCWEFRFSHMSGEGFFGEADLTKN